MKVLIDSSIWSLALRRRDPDVAIAGEVARLLRADNVILIGIVRQEVLSGVPDPDFYTRLRDQLRKLPDHPIDIKHYERAAELFNLCRSKGIQGSLTDYLLCALSELEGLPIYTSDLDFKRYAKIVSLHFHHVA